MFGSTVLDIAIGIVFIYLMLSLVVTAANELLAALIKARGNTLWRGICNLLPTGDPSATSSVGKKNFAQAVYDHPLVDGLAQSSRPSYIPSRVFALALLDTVAETTDGKIEVEALRPKIAALPDSLRKPLQLLLHEANGDLEQFKLHIEVWFNHAMDRVSGWYKRIVQYVLFGIAGLLTVLLNVDTVLLINHLSRDSALRASLVAQASQYTEAHPPAPAPTGKKGSVPPIEINGREDELQASIAALDALDLPIGWTNTPPMEKAVGLTPAVTSAVHELQLKEDRALPTDVFGGDHSLWAVLHQHFLGWLVTTLAISLGAPFWFDVLNRFVNIRASGKAPEERPKKPRAVPQPVAPGGS